MIGILDVKLFPDTESTPTRTVYKPIIINETAIIIIIIIIMLSH
jgi:hypothetical protein